jgi:hypothetical protein
MSTANCQRIIIIHVCVYTYYHQINKDEIHVCTTPGTVAVLGIISIFTYSLQLYNYTVCLLVRSCCLTQRYTYQSKSLNEISLNPLGPRDRQSTLRFEKSISAAGKKKSSC